MQRSGEKLSLQWNDFESDISSSFRDLRLDNEFTDVTLACEDGQQVEAHKVVLISSSPFFLSIFKRNKHPHPLIFMRGLNYEDLLSMVDFLYHGEANVFRDNLDEFLAIAEELQLKGLKREEDFDQVPFEKDSKVQIPMMEKDSKSKKSKCSLTRNNPLTTSIDISPTQRMKYEALDSPSSGTVLAHDNFTDLEELDKKVKSMMSLSENQLEKHGKARKCKECGKEGQMINIMSHIEANHMTNISIPCNDCGKIQTTRHGLNVHKRRHHSRSIPANKKQNTSFGQ